VPDYRLLDGLPATERKRTTEGLQRLRAALDTEIPAKTLDSTLLLATWNIRELDSPKYGLRDDEAYLYLAEVISRFDVVAVQEVRDDLQGLNRLNAALGRRWRRIMTDVTEGTAGNGERMAFLYDSRTTEFTGLASELVLPPLPSGKPADQVARTPFAVGFRSGWSTFQLATVHIIYGSDKAEDPRRVEEIGRVAQALSDRAQDPKSWPRTLVILGDFNIYARTDKTMLALTEHGWVVPDELQSIPGSNVPKDKHYDQIAVQAKAELRQRFTTTGKAGVFDAFEHVYRDEDEATFVDTLGPAYATANNGKKRTDAGRHNYYRDWRTHQLSDHLPMWLEVVTDYADDYLKTGGSPDEVPVD
jgi:endonuclease/exonuclease/phosphatase family metal-dependent hydrolase